MKPPSAAETRRRVRFEHERTRMRVVSYVLLVPVFLYIATDLFLAKGDLGALVRLAALRIGVVAVVISALERVAREESEASFVRYLTIGCVVTSAIAVSIHLMRPRGLAAPFFADLISLIGVYLLLADRWRRALVPALGQTVADLLLLFFWHEGLPLPITLGVTISFLIANALCLASGIQRERLDHALEALAVAQEPEGRPMTPRVSA